MIEVSLLAKQINSEAIKWRRDFHKNPELGYQEYETAKFIDQLLSEWGYETHTGIAETGIVATLNQESSRKKIAIRVDMDALPVLEQTNLPFMSNNKGRMHACGHDMHMAIGLGLAKILSEKSELSGFGISFIFQPAEELLSGARTMLEKGALDFFETDVIFGLHVWNQMPVGQIAINSGPVMASIDAFEIVIKGQGGHGSSPELTVDPLITAAQLAISAQTIISRNISAKDNAVLSITSIQAGDTINVIPHTAILKGSIRTYDENVRQLIKTRFKTIAMHTTKAMDCELDFYWLDHAPALINDERVVQSVKPILEKVPYKNISDFQLMGSEDASYFWNKIPGIYSFIGAKIQDINNSYGHHHPKFEVDEKAIQIGIEIMLAKICQYLETPWRF